MTFDQKHAYDAQNLFKQCFLNVNFWLVGDTFKGNSFDFAQICTVTISNN